MHSPIRPFILSAAMFWVLAAVCPFSAICGVSAAQSQPQPVTRLVTKTSAFTDQEQAEVEAYVRYWIEQIATGEPGAIRNALRALEEPLNRMGVTRVFRDEYARAAVPRLETLLGQSTNYEVAVNALKAGSLFGTDRALRLMVERSDPAREERAAVRLWAAKGFQLLVESDQIDARQLSTMARGLARAAEREENWLVLRRQFEALASVPNSVNHQVDVLVATTLRLAEDEKAPTPVMESLHRALVLLRNQWINMANVAARQNFGAAAGPAIVRVLEIVDAHWEKAQEKERPRAWYGSAVQSAETLLVAIDIQVRPNRTSAPDTALDASWQRRDQEAFRRSLRLWQDITGRAPYAQPQRQ